MYYKDLYQQQASRYRNASNSGGSGGSGGTDSKTKEVTTGEKIKNFFGSPWTIAIIILIAVVLIAAYFYFYRSSGDIKPSTSTFSYH